MERGSADDPRASAWRKDLEQLSEMVQAFNLRLVVTSKMAERLGEGHGYEVVEGSDKEVVRKVLRRPDAVLVGASYFHLAAGWRQPRDVSSLVDRGRIVAESLCSGTKGYMGLKVVDRRKLLGGIERISQAPPAPPSEAPSTPTAGLASDPDADVRAEEVERWLSADPNDLTTNCVVCGKPETVHMGDGGYDCLLRSSRWLISQGVVVPGSAMRRQLGQAWPAELKDRMVTGVELNSNQFGKYRRSWSRIYRTFVSGVPARDVAQQLLLVSEDFRTDTLRELVRECQLHLAASPQRPETVLREFIAKRSNEGPTAADI